MEEQSHFLPEYVQKEIITFCHLDINSGDAGLSKMFFSAESFGLSLYLRILRLKYIPLKNEPLIQTEKDATALVVAKVGLQKEYQGKGYFSILIDLIESNCSKHKFITFENVYDGEDATLPHILLKKEYKPVLKDKQFESSACSYWYKEI